MGKAGEKQKRRPKIKDKRQSERFKEVAREVGADESSKPFEEAMSKLAPPKVPARKCRLKWSAPEGKKGCENFDSEALAREKADQLAKDNYQVFVDLYFEGEDAEWTTR
jgi:hypothetical protein